MPLPASPLHLLHLGAITGAFAGMLESFLMGLSQGTGVVPATVVNTTVYYAIIWGVVGLLIGVAARLLPGWRLAWLDRPLLGSLLVSFVALVLVASYVNMMFLPSMFSPMSFGIDFVMLVGAVILCWVLVRVWRGLSRHSTGRPWLRSPLVIITILLIVGLVAIGAAPSRDDGVSMTVEGGHTENMNVLLLVVDALRADHLGCYGYDIPTSPNMDRMAHEGVLFMNAFAQGSRTKETTASIVTSYYASSHGVCDVWSILPESSPTMMELARAADYRTAVVSANSLVSPTFGFDRGVDYFYCDSPSVVGRTLIMQTAQRLGARAKPLRWLPRLLRSADVLLPMPDERNPFDGIDPNAMNEAFLSWLDEDPERDFFAYIHYMDPHAPYAPPPPYDSMYDPDYTGEMMEEMPVFPGTMLPFDEADPLPEDKHRNLVAHYDGAITYFDEALGRLLEELDRRDLSERTLIVIVADHGEEFFDHRGWGHGQSVYNELIRVPLIMYLPGLLPSDTRVEATVRQIDLLPTMMGLVGVEETVRALDFDGVNLSQFLVGGRSDWPEPPVMAEVFHDRHFSRTLKSGDHKVVYAKCADAEHVMLFDLSTDPGEMNDIADEMPDLTESLFAQLENLHSGAVTRSLDSGATTIDEGTKEKLRALGYIR